MEKLDIASAYCLPLVKKIQLDLQRTHEDEAVNKLHPLWASGPYYNIIHNASSFISVRKCDFMINGYAAAESTEAVLTLLMYFIECKV